VRDLIYWGSAAALDAAVANGVEVPFNRLWPKSASDAVIGRPESPDLARLVDRQTRERGNGTRGVAVAEGLVTFISTRSGFPRQAIANEAALNRLVTTGLREISDDWYTKAGPDYGSPVNRPCKPRLTKAVLRYPAH